MEKVRKVSCNELLYLDMQDLTNSYAIQFVLKIKKMDNIKNIEDAINKVIKNNIGSYVFMKNKKYYINDNDLKIEKRNINNKDFYNSNIFSEKIDIKKESIKVYFIKNKYDQSEYLLFKFLHSVMDGKGCLLFIENFKKCLKNEVLINCNNYITDYEFLKDKNYYKESLNKKPKIKHSKSNIIKSCKSKWRIIDVDCYVPSIVAKLSKVFADEFENENIKIMIPTDIRRHDRLNNYIGNLTLPIFLNVNKKDSISKINGDLLFQLKNNRELNIANTSYYGYQYFPKIIRNAVLKIGNRWILKNNKFSIGALISHLGRIDIDDLKNEEISFSDFVSLPIHQPLGAFSVVIVEYSHKTKIALTYYENQFNEEYIDYLGKKIKDSLSNNIYCFNNTLKEYQSNYIKAIDNHLRNSGSKVAVIDNNRKYTYDDLLKNVSKYNEIIKVYKIKERVILYINRGFDYISALLSCIYNNITFIPIDKTTTLERIKLIIDESKAKFIITDEDSDFKNINAIHINEICKYKGIDIKPNYKKSDEVYDIYTSGTTGIPKCVPISNNNLNNYLMWCMDEYKVIQNLVMPLFTSLSVDLTITSTFLPLVCGGIIKTFSDNFNINILKKIVEDKEINIIKCTPTHLAFILTADYKITPKEIFIIGGENLSSELCNKISKLFSTAKLYNEYGPSEATVATIFHIYDNKKDTKLVSIGKPIYNTKVLIYDGNVVKEENKRGEIIISGDSVFDGYSNVKKDCFINIDNIKYYKTGDVGYVSDGDVYCIGRSDNQVKIHGNRVELDEISNEINKISNIKESVVLYEKELYAFVIKNGNISEKDIKQELAKKYPNYMIPYKIIFLKNFPIKENGKINSKKLLESIKPIKRKNRIINDQLINLLYEIRPLQNISKEKSLFEIGLESFDIIVFSQKIIDKYIDSKDEEKFTDFFFKNITTITLYDIEKLIIEYGGKL